MAPFYGWGSTASRLQSHYEFPGVPGTQMIDLGRMKGWVDLEPPSGLKPGPLDYKIFPLTELKLYRIGIKCF